MVFSGAVGGDGNAPRPVDRIFLDCKYMDLTELASNPETKQLEIGPFFTCLSIPKYRVLWSDSGWTMENR